MASVLALISKSVFDQLPTRQLGSVIPLDRYTSKHAAFDKLGPGDSLFLVTVRPEGPLLVAVIDRPARSGDSLVGTTNVTALTSITVELRQLKLADGKGITATPDKLGMSLQTPRVLADGDAQLLRGLGGKGTPVATAPVLMKLAPKKLKADVAKPVAKTAAKKAPKKAAKTSAVAAPKWVDGKLSARARDLVSQVYRNPDDRALRVVLADQLVEDHHVWGELISLQLSDPKKHAVRIKAIIQKHAPLIVGNIANVASRPDLDIVDGFPVGVRCAKSKSFTSAEQRRSAAKAPEWATVKHLTLTHEMPGVFAAELLNNPATANLTRIDYGGVWQPKQPIASRSGPGEAWRIDPKAKQARRLFEALPEKDLARVVPPEKDTIRIELDQVRAQRQKKAGAKR